MTCSMLAAYYAEYSITVCSVWGKTHSVLTVSVLTLTRRSMLPMGAERGKPVVATWPECCAQPLNCTKTVGGETVTYAACASLSAVFNGGYDLYWTLDEKVEIKHDKLTLHDATTRVHQLPVSCNLSLSKFAISAQILPDAQDSTGCRLCYRPPTRPSVCGRRRS